MFFLIDWDLNSEINIHTFHRTEHLVTIYFKGKFFSSHQAVGQMGKNKLMCGFLVTRTNGLKTSTLVDAAEGKKVRTAGSHCWERKHLFYVCNMAFPSKIHS